MFNSLTGYSNQRSYHALLVAPVGLRQGFRALVEREMEHARAGRPARIIIKNNAVADPAHDQDALPRVAGGRAAST